MNLRMHHSHEAMHSPWGLITPQIGGASAAAKRTLRPMVEEADAHVQGESLKASATLPI
jgi:hypothetical protein